MQKVITVHTHTNTAQQHKNFDEIEFPQLSSYLEQGYTVQQVIPVVTNSSSYMYSLTFVLEKPANEKPRSFGHA